MFSSPSIHSAYALIQPYIHRTPLLTNHTLNTIASSPQSPESLTGTPFEGQTPAQPRLRFFFKCENFQRIGAFKARGAFHALLRLIEDRGEGEVKRRGVITHSSGLSLFLLMFGAAVCLNGTDAAQETTHKLSPWPRPRSTSPPTSSCRA